MDPRYSVLFEPVRIGPVTAPDRFYQVPHCTGIADRAPDDVAAMREIMVTVETIGRVRHAYLVETMFQLADKIAQP